MTTVVERKYQMTRVRAGDYILPSNDLTRIWRISSYTEDGSAEDWNGRPVYGTFWQCAYFDGSTERFQRLLAADPYSDNDILSWDYWNTWEMGLRTRKEAVTAAMRARP